MASNWIPPGFDRDMVGRDYPGIAPRDSGVNRRPDRGTRHDVPAAPERPRPGPPSTGVPRDNAKELDR